LRAQELLEKWLPGADVIQRQGKAVDTVLVWRGPKGIVRYLLEFKNHLPQQDIQVVAHQLEQLTRGLPKTKTVKKALLLAPYIPPRQAEFLRRRGIDYADEAGNVHLDARGIFVHVEGKRLDRLIRPGTITKAWVKVTLAGLLNPILFDRPYHQLAAAAGVTPPTVMSCLRDLERRGVLDRRGRRRRLVGRKEVVPLWTQAYVNVLRPRLPERQFRVLQAEDVAETLKRVNDVLMHHEIPWCATGAAAALQLTHYYQTNVVEIYATQRAITDPIARELQAQPTKGEANFVVIEPPIPTLLAGAEAQQAAIPIAPPVLVHAELRYHGTEQANDAAELLLPLIEAQNAHTP
jgi:hypothetical protein